MFLYVVSLLLSLFQFMFILCQKDNVAENLICGDSFLVRIVQVFVTVIHINRFKTNCDMYVSSKRMIQLCQQLLLSVRVTCIQVHEVFPTMRTASGIVLSVLKELQCKT